MSKYLLIEDECAPDAREFFEKEFKEKVGVSLQEFREKAVREKNKDDGYSVVYIYVGFKLSYSADDPYYHLSKIEE